MATHRAFLRTINHSTLRLKEQAGIESLDLWNSSWNFRGGAYHGSCSFGEITLQTEVEAMMKREQGRNSLSVPTPQSSVGASHYPTPLEARGPGFYDAEQGGSLPDTPQARQAGVEVGGGGDRVVVRPRLL